jgi:hypothetical protein
LERVLMNWKLWSTLQFNSHMPRDFPRLLFLCDAFFAHLFCT